MSDANRSATVRIGPAGWSYRDWIGPVYPAQSKVDELLTIATYFTCVELNSSFYRVPSPRLVESWAERIGGKGDFKFTVKVWQRFTHEMKGSREEAERFIEVFRPLLARARVGAFLLQFPWSFSDGRSERRLLETLGAWFGSHPTAVELRHGSWNTPEAMAFLAGCGLSFCNIDQPIIGPAMPPTDIATSPRLGYIRLHGRNYRNWARRDAERDERYDYLYADGELEEWKERSRRLASKVGELYIITNNHFRGQALVNALQLRSMLEERRQEVPPPLLTAYPVLEAIAANPTPRDTLF